MDSNIIISGIGISAKNQPQAKKWSCIIWSIGGCRYDFHNVEAWISCPVHYFLTYPLFIFHQYRGIGFLTAFPR